MPEDDAPAAADVPDADDLGETVVEDLAVLDVDATVGEVMTAVHWIEDHTPGLGTDPQCDPKPIVRVPARPVRRRAPVVRVLPT